MTNWFDEIKETPMFQEFELTVDEKFLDMPKFIPNGNYIGERKVNAKKLEKRRKKNAAARKARKKS